MEPKILGRAPGRARIRGGMNDSELEAAVKLREQGDVEGARTRLLALADARPGDPAVLYQCAWAHDAAGKERAAVEFYERALAAGLAGEDRAGAWLGLGSTLRGLGEYPRAIAALDRGASEHPDDPAIAVFRAMALYNSGRGKEALADVLRLLADTTADDRIARFARAIRLYAEDLDRVWDTLSAPIPPLLLRIHHAQITVPPGQEDAARAFYRDALGLEEVPKPEPLRGRGGFWLQLGDVQVHVGSEDGVGRERTKAHLAYEVSDLEACRRKLRDLGVEPIASIPIPGYARFEFRDPFGNRVEFLQSLP